MLLPKVGEAVEEVGQLSQVVVLLEDGFPTLEIMEQVLLNVVEEEISLTILDMGESHIPGLQLNMVQSRVDQVDLVLSLSLIDAEHILDPQRTKKNTYVHIPLGISQGYGRICLVTWCVCSCLYAVVDHEALYPIF